MMKRLLRSAVYSLFLMFQASNLAQAETLVLNGQTRSYELDQAAGESRGLIIALHGGGGSAKRFRRNSGIREAAESTGYSIAWPDSDGGNWNDGRRNSEGKIINDIDDEGFLLALIDHLIAIGAAKREKVFITGHSNGGMMSFYMGCKYPRVFKGISPVSANVPRPMDCAGQGAIAMLNIVGLRDRIVPFEGGGIFGRTRRGELLSVPESFNALAKRNRCKGNSVQNGNEVIRLVGRSCQAATLQLRVKDQGHRFPDTAAQAIVSFFGEL
jgi:polyhydroxybutyrate depolymerase